MSEPIFSLDLLYQAIELHLQENLAGVKMVGAWPEIEGNVIPLPAVFLELAEIEPGTDIGSGETVLVCKFEARIIVDVIMPDHQRQAVHLATQLAVLLRAQTWGLAVEPAAFVQALHDWTKPELDGYTVWLVEWTQTIYLGVIEWPWPDQPPGTLMVGFNQDTGLGNEERYFAPEDLL